MEQNCLFTDKERLSQIFWFCVRKLHYFYRIKRCFSFKSHPVRLEGGRANMDVPSSDNKRFPDALMLSAYITPKRDHLWKICFGVKYWITCECSASKHANASGPKVISTAVQALAWWCIKGQMDCAVLAAFIGSRLNMDQEKLMHPRHVYVDFKLNLKR